MTPSPDAAGLFGLRRLDAALAGARAQGPQPGASVRPYGDPENIWDNL